MSLFGREAHLVQARALLAGPVRLLTVCGPPGVGKSAFVDHLLAGQPATATVPLATVDDPEAFAASVTPVLARMPRGWLVLDGLDALVTTDRVAVTAHLRGALDAHPTVGFVVTCRQPLHLDDEEVLPLPPLPTPAATQLFAERAGCPSDGLEPLVTALDGLPLALELAAARWELLGTEGLLRRLSTPSSSRDTTLHRVFGETWDLLAPADRTALEALTVFHQPFRVADAEQLLGADAMAHIEALRDQGLLRVVSPGRLALLSTVRTFARERIAPDRAQALADAHADWLLHRFADLDAGPAVEDVHQDLAVAVRHLLDQTDPRAVHLLELLEIARPARHLDLFDAAVHRLDSAGARLVRSRAVRLAGRAEEAAQDVAIGLGMAPDARTRTMLELMVGTLAYDRGDLDAAAEAFEGAMALATEAGNVRTGAMTLFNLASIDVDRGRSEDAEWRYETALDRFHAIGDTRHEALCLLGLGLLRHEQRLLPSAEVAFARAVDTMQTHGHRALAFAEGTLGLLLHERGRLDEALALHERATTRLATSANGRARSLALARRAATEAALGDLAQARTHILAATMPGGAWPLDDTARGFVRLFEAFVARAEQRPDEVKRLVEEAVTRIGARTDARIALRMLRQGPVDAGPALLVGDDWYHPPGGERVDLTRYDSMRRMFAALVAAHGTDRTLGVDELFAAGWPGEQITVASARNRVHVNLAKLRARGLRGLILRRGEGYQLDPSLGIRR